MTTKHSTHKLVLAITAAIMAAGGAQAYEVPLTGINTNLPPVDFHGFASQGLLASSQYNYLADNTKTGSLEFFEAGVNASMDPFPRTHITAQGFMFDVGDIGQYKPVLDYASVTYTFNDEIGVRGGRIRRPQGIYNEIIDVDLARTSVLLPQGIYDARWRDFYADLDGGEIFGSLPLSKAGSLSYDGYAGYAHPSTSGGVGNVIKNDLPPGSSVDSLNSPFTLGGQLWWNTPLDGVRVGAAYYHAFNFQQNLTVNLPPPPFGPGPVPSSSSMNVDNTQESLEYLWRNWTFQAEYMRTWLEPGNIDDAWYANVAYRFNKWFEAGTYYTEYYSNVQQRDNSLDYQKDLALSFRFDPKPWWVLKLEGHYIRGTGLLDNNANNPNQNSGAWFMLAVKTTFSF
jgi:hypothetical protein